MKRRARLSISAALVAAAVFAAAAPSEAGVIVLKNGEVLIGRIRADEDTQEELIMRWPYKERTDRGEIKIPKFRIRWYDRDADEPTDAYWEKYENENIDSKWMPSLEKWRIRRRSQTEGHDVLVFEGFDSPRGKLSPVPVQTSDFEIRKPDGWTSANEDGIIIFVSDQAGIDGYRARIHVFAVPSLPKESTEKQVEWVQREIARLGQGSGNKFEVRESGRLKPARGGFDQELLTSTTRGERTVFSLRQVSFRDKKTYFFSAYADERDFSGLEILFKACMRSLQIHEDQRAQPGSSPPGATPPPATPR
ncbi:MAG: hypothetical protein M9894_05340 [Planctomycetes bacterium]|nr:hypothetical protein [Planctomycetota bacterium]